MRFLTVVALSLICTTSLSAEVPKGAGRVVSVRTGDAEQDERLNKRLHFCLFENGEHDLLYAGTNYGLWDKGWIELTIDDKKVFSGEVPRLLYEGVLLDVGNVLKQKSESNTGQYITKVHGWFK